MTIQLSHFSARFCSPLFASVVFGITQRNATARQIRYGLYCFAMFIGWCDRGGLGDVADSTLIVSLHSPVFSKGYSCSKGCSSHRTRLPVKCNGWLIADG